MAMEIMGCITKYTFIGDYKSILSSVYSGGWRENSRICSPKDNFNTGISGTQPFGNECLLHCR